MNPTDTAPTVVPVAPTSTVAATFAALRPLPFLLPDHPDFDPARPIDLSGDMELPLFLRPLLVGRPVISTNEILTDLGRPFREATSQGLRRLAAAMRALGYVARRETYKGSRTMVYVNSSGVPVPASVEASVDADVVPKPLPYRSEPLDVRLARIEAMLGRLLAVCGLGDASDPVRPATDLGEQEREPLMRLACLDVENPWTVSYHRNS